MQRGVEKTTSVEEKLYKGGDNAGPGGLSAASKVKRGKLDTEEKANNKWKVRENIYSREIERPSLSFWLGTST